MEASPAGLLGECEFLSLDSTAFANGIGECVLDNCGPCHPRIIHLVHREQ